MTTGQMILNLLLAHVIGDFYCQTGRSCNGKREKGLMGIDLYVHAFIILVLSWLSAWSWSFWWAALVIGVIHLFIDASKAAVERKLKIEGQPIYMTRYAVWPFVIDQVFHVAVIAFVFWWWLQYNDWCLPSWEKVLGTHNLLLILALLLSWKPANLLVKHILVYCQVGVLDKTKGQLANYKVGALIGTLERWLIIFFMSIQQYVAIGFLVAAKSIRDFGVNRESEKSEYVLAGTMLSISIGIATGLLLFIK
ncbi:MAG: DUF3307 domain-containing protein [Muribaculaceae bacterium]|nr:DUF3307 domain-containing protein [Muribaculaceae bacterium]